MEGWTPDLSSDALGTQVLFLLDISDPKERLSLVLPWSKELSTGQGTEEELRKGPGWGQRDKETQVPDLRNSATQYGEKPQTGQRWRVREPCLLGTSAGFC